MAVVAAALLARGGSIASCLLVVPVSEVSCKSTKNEACRYVSPGPASSCSHSIDPFFRDASQAR